MPAVYHAEVEDAQPQLQSPDDSPLPRRQRQVPEHEQQRREQHQPHLQPHRPLVALSNL